uniref:Uncharacterized protein n=1 Tax=Rhizophora mucronata TaxID=61149 RepID=A0A2P2ITX0_RHIMU
MEVLGPLTTFIEVLGIIWSHPSLVLMLAMITLRFLSPKREILTPCFNR